MSYPVPHSQAFQAPLEQSRTIMPNYGLAGHEPTNSSIPCKFAYTTRSYFFNIGNYLRRGRFRTLSCDRSIYLTGLFSGSASRPFKADDSTSEWMMKISFSYIRDVVHSEHKVCTKTSTSYPLFFSPTSSSSSTHHLSLLTFTTSQTSTWLTFSTPSRSR